MYDMSRLNSIEDIRKYLLEIINYQEILQPSNLINTDFEIWKDLKFPGIKSIYKISSYGQIYSKVSKRILSQAKTSSGHMTIGLQSEDNSRVSKYVHILVAYNFLEYINGYVVHHINTIPNDNRVCNLAYISIEKNSYYARILHEGSIFVDGISYTKNNWSNGSITYGTNNGMCKYPDSLVHEICKYLSQGYSYRDICNLVSGLNKNNNSDYYYISSIARGIKRRDISKLYEIKEK